MSSSHSSFYFCQRCGTYPTGARRCGACKEAFYCGENHQKQDWKDSTLRGNKASCKFVQRNPASVWIEVEEREGNGLGNTTVNHAFPNKQEGFEFAKAQFGGNIGFPLRSFFCELLGYSVEIYCSTSCNDFSDLFPSGRVNGSYGSQAGLNGAGIYLGCGGQSELSSYNNMKGKIFVTGRRNRDGRPLVSDALWGILNFIWDAMDLYGDEEDPMSVITKWSREYHRETWTPRGGDAGINVYNTRVEDCTL